MDDSLVFILFTVRTFTSNFYQVTFALLLSSTTSPFFADFQGLFALKQRSHEEQYHLICN